MKCLFFDIETGPAQDAHLFEPVFEASRVLKDPSKIAADIEDKRRQWLDKLALSALTGQVLAIGWAAEYGEVETVCQDGNTDEAEVIRQFWAATIPAVKIVGYNSNTFDLPYLWRRSFKLGIEIPNGIFDVGRRLSANNIDLMERWMWFDNQSRVSLDNMAKFCGLPQKTGSGKFFSELFQTDRAAAIAYLVHDVELTRQIGGRMGIC